MVNDVSMYFQAVVDADMRFIHCNASYPGGSHDAFIWGESELKAAFERGFFGGSCLLDGCDALYYVICS